MLRLTSMTVKLVSGTGVQDVRMSPSVLGKVLQLAKIHGWSPGTRRGAPDAQACGTAEILPHVGKYTPGTPYRPRMLKAFGGPSHEPWPWATQPRMGRRSSLEVHFEVEDHSTARPSPWQPLSELKTVVDVPQDGPTGRPTCWLCCGT